MTKTGNQDFFSGSIETSDGATLVFEEGVLTERHEADGGVAIADLADRTNTAGETETDQEETDQEPAAEETPTQAPDSAPPETETTQPPTDPAPAGEVQESPGDRRRREREEARRAALKSVKGESE